MYYQISEPNIIFVFHSLLTYILPRKKLFLFVSGLRVLLLLEEIKLFNDNIISFGDRRHLLDRLLIRTSYSKWWLKNILIKICLSMMIILIDIVNNAISHLILN